MDRKKTSGPYSRLIDQPGKTLRPSGFQLCSIRVHLLFLLFVCSSASAQMAPRFEAPRAAEQLNSSADDYAPTISPDGELFLTSEREGRALFYRLSSNWMAGGAEPILVDGLINGASPRNQSFLSFTPEGRAYFSSFRLLQRRPVLNIFTSEQEIDGWREPVPVANLNSDHFTAHPALSPSGATIVFTSNRPGGRGGTDLWMSTRRPNGRWETPINLGAVLNSPGDEITPYFASENELYFSSNGFGGRGGYDLFMSVRAGGVWQAPVPIKSVNTQHHESDCVILANGAILFASDRPGGSGGLDFWMAERIIEQATTQLNVEYILERNAPAITVRETALIAAIDLLPYVFFSENSAELPTAQKLLSRGEADSFNESTLLNDPQVLHADLLNIIGSRMQRFADAKLQVLGAADEYGAAENADLGRRRAQSVVRYLTEVWEIDPERFTIAGRGLPRNPSTSQLAEGRAENRRVELSGDSRVLSAVNLQSNRTQVEGAALRLTLDARPRQAVRSWSLQLRNSYDKVIAGWNGADLPAYLDFSAADVPADDFGQELNIEFSGVDSQGRRGARRSRLPVERVSTTIGGRYQESADAKIRRYQLPPFAYDQAELNTAQETMVYEIVNSIPASSEVVVTGYTDVLGSDVRNQALANQRALAVARRIGKLAPGLAVTVEAQGSRELFDNATPLGRFLSRTVRVLVRSVVD